MKYFGLWIIIAIAFCDIACSESNRKECELAMEIFADFESQTVQIGTGIAKLKDATGVKKASAAAAELIRKLNAARLTDKRLLSIKFAALSNFNSFKRTLDAVIQTNASVTQAAELKSGYNALLQEAENTLQSACEKKLRSRRAARSKQLECRVIYTLLERISVDSIGPEGLQNVAQGLQNLSVSNKKVRASVDRVADRLLELKETLIIEMNLENKLHNHALQWEKHTAKLQETTASLKHFCTASL